MGTQILNLRASNFFLSNILKIFRNLVLNPKFRNILRKRLNRGTVPPFKMHPGGTVPPVKMHPGGTVPPFKMHPGGTLNFYEFFFLSLNLDWGSKINDRSLRPFLNLSPLSLISLPPPHFQLGLDQMYASMLILEEQSLHLKCTLSVGTIH